jgi:hypothetical protein
MNESVEKFSEQSVVERALILRAKMASDDLYKQHIYCITENELSHKKGDFVSPILHENHLSTQITDATVWDDWTDWENI